jgi:hypothetical protein
MAANAYKLYQVCLQCNGSGTILNEKTETAADTETCPMCLGAKVVLWGYCTEAIFSIPEIPT